VLREGAEPAVLVDGLSSPKGLCNLPDGRIGIAESGTGRILAHGPAGLEVLAENLRGIDQLACGADGSLWAVISQNRSGELVRIKDGRRQVIARHLRQPQGIALAPDGGLYLAETGADRLLHLAPR
jgi:glucose/arabinose dehydrogenase